jgi:SAM-dependent methyltransferase
MLELLLPYMRCTRCASPGLRPSRGGVSCRECAAVFAEREGILDMLAEEANEVITPFQRVMQTTAVAAVYERAWRPLGYWIAAARPFSIEVARVLELLGEGDQGRVLDLACGPGVFTRRLAERDRGVVVGFDLSWPMLRRASRAARREGLDRVVWIRGSVFCLPFLDGSFPAINCAGALHLFDRPEEALSEVSRVLGRGGRLAVQTAVRPSGWAGVLGALDRLIRFGSFREEDLREMLRRQRLKVVELERHRISCTLLARQAG